MNITLEKYNEIIERLDDCVTQYEKMNYWYNNHIMYLANGDTVSIKFPKNNIAHLLGVNIDYLKMSNKFRSDMNTFECLKYFLNNSYTFSKLVTEEKKMSFDSMFSPYIESKLDCFIKNIKIRTDDIYFILKYDREKTYQIVEDADICDYYIVRLINGAYYMLGITTGENGISLPVTSRKYDDYLEFERFITKVAKKQEITYPYYMKIKNSYQDFETQFFTNLDDKKILLDKAIRFSTKYDATASVARDFSYNIGNSITNRTKRNEEMSILQLLTDSIKSKSVLDYDTINSVCEINGVSEDIQYLIDACNDMMLNNSSSGSILESYSEISNQRDSLKKELEQTKQLLLESNNKIKELTDQNQQLLNDNNNYMEQFEIIENAVQKVKK